MMIVTKLQQILLLLHQIASITWPTPGHSVLVQASAGDQLSASFVDDIFDSKASSWPPSADKHNLSSALGTELHKQNHHHRHPKTKRRWEDEGRESSASSRQPTFAVGDLHEDRHGVSSVPESSESRKIGLKSLSQQSETQRPQSSSNFEQHHVGGGSLAAVATSKDRFWLNNRFSHHTDWCSRDCEQLANNYSATHNHANAHSICASDGRLYESMCQLKRHSCRHNVRLRRRPRTFCSAPEQQRGYPIAAAATTTADQAASRDRVRIVELKKLCDAQEYTRMKRLMFNEFNGNIRSMFRYYDVDADKYIEAHELWPVETASEEGAHGRLIYAQVWENHTTKCPQNNDDDHGDHSKCWYFLDFAFQPQYPKNPCSLSHLMLFDLKHPNHMFDFETFAEAFANFTKVDGKTHNNKNSVENRTIKKVSKIIIGLGDNIDLKCLADSPESKMGVKNDVIKENDNDSGDNDNDDGDENDNYLTEYSGRASSRCTWTRYDSNLAASKDAHISISEQQQQQQRGRNEREHDEHISTRRDILLHITEAQLYLSGQFKCICHFQELLLEFEHTYHLQVLAEPRVRISPHYQWSLPKSRISFECQYDQINTNTEEDDDDNHSSSDRIHIDNQNKPRNSPIYTDAVAAMGNQDEHKSRFGLGVEWKKENKVLGEKQQQLLNKEQTTLKPISQGDDPLVDQLFEFSREIRDSFDDDDHEPKDSQQIGMCNTSSRVSMTTATSKLILENLQQCDSGQFTCRVELPQRSILNPTQPIVGQDTGQLLVQDRPREDLGQQQQQTADDNERQQSASALWIFHENGISVYKMQDDDGQEMELMREINGHSSISAQVEGNWNRLTLCGGLNSEQAVICEWSDNAVLINVGDHGQRGGTTQTNNDKQQGRRSYVYVGQPNLNRVLVFDSFKFEIVAIINTEPQPRRLHLYQPNKIHLSKWVKRRLSPIANVRWESAIGTGAHSSESTPQESRLYSAAPFVGGGPDVVRTTLANSNVDATTIGAGGRTKRSPTTSSHTNGVVAAEPSLIQHDIWLLCYGRPLVPLDPPSSLDNNNNQQQHHHHRHHRSTAAESGASKQSADSSSFTAEDHAIDNKDNNRDDSSLLRKASRQLLQTTTETSDSIKPFEPRLSPVGNGVVFPPPFAWPSNIWSSSSASSYSGAGDNNNKEARLRNRKSVHIIQSTFLPISGRFANDGSVHRHPNDYDDSSTNHHDKLANFTVVDRFKQSSVISTHHIYPGPSLSATNRFSHFANGNPASPSQQMPLQRISLIAAGRRRHRRHYVDLIQDLLVPQKPFSMEKNAEFKIHYAYVTHYDERRLSRISMDNYRYDREIDLQDCDPVHMLTTAQGLIVIQCRAPISHSLIGQLVLDQLTSARIEFNANIRAQESYLSPDNRYLVSIFHDASATSPTTTDSKNNYDKGQRPGGEIPSSGEKSINYSSDNDNSNNSAASDQMHRWNQSSQATTQQRHSSIVYVQTVTVDGLRLQYEIKTLFEINQCSFVWKDGYYAAIFVTTNSKEQQSEILSLRLIDSRLELMARVPGLASGARHKEQLIVSPELSLAALTTNQGTFVIDLEENRVSQSLRRHQLPPTLLWV